MPVAIDARVKFPLATFRAAFREVSRVVPVRSPKPILMGVRLDLERGWATLSATDLEHGIRTRIECDHLDDPVSTVIPAALLGSILRVAEGDELEMEIDGSSATITCPSAEWVVQTQDAMLFPEVPGFTATTYHSIEAERLALAIRRTEYATDKLSTTYALGGVCCEPLLTALEFTAVDGRVLANQKIEATAVGGSPASISPVIPLKSIGIIQAIIPDSLDMVDLGFDGTSVQVRIGESNLFSRLVEGRFPAWKRAIPNEKPIGCVSVKAGDLKKAVAKVATHLSSETKSVEMLFADDRLLLTCRSAAGEAEAEVRIEWGHEEVSHLVNPLHLASMLGSLDDDVTPTLEIREDGPPIVVKCDDGFLGLIYTYKRS